MKKTIPSANKTLCILANTKVGDLYGSKIVNSLKTNFNLTDIKIIGNGGENLKKHGQNSIINLEDLREKYLNLWRYSIKNINNTKYAPSNLYQVSVRANENLIRLVSKNKNFTFNFNF